ncbi:DUF1365 domain-containing protein [Rhodococcoides trifolii]|uniref:DUF1365 domain-containing protein n=1 Tax=Rhodococcoides trifolii TaxID=908250 RepID=A0A917D7T9_9NOCA|nr:DUF1365 domain-containing protein [Rhodococcus trifolii]GGG12022.1 DUF1365 domain-containing protein [Rhodococcus trifolii]
MSAAPALYDTRIRHVRTGPIQNEFTYRSYSWLVDIDRLPRLSAPLRPFARFEASDHLGDPSATLRENVDAFLAARGIDLRGGRVDMLASARVLGYVFNPLSVFWCHDRDGTLECVIAEVHNTYGESHCYLVRTDERGAARTAKEFYVSPFNDVEGEYRMRLPEPNDTLALSIVLHRDNHPPFVATVTGTRRPASPRHIVRTVTSLPMAPLVASAQIRLQGIKLWKRGLTVVPRPVHTPQEAVQ